MKIKQNEYIKNNIINFIFNSQKNIFNQFSPTKTAKP